MKYKKFVPLCLGILLTLTGRKAFAENLDPYAGITASPGETAVGVQTSTVRPKNLSFEVPLYATIAVASGETDVAVPTNYKITNTSKLGSVSKPIAIIGVSAKKPITSSGWEFVVGEPISDGQIHMTVGGVNIKNLSTTFQPLELAGSMFMNSGKYRVLAGEETLTLPITAKVKAQTITENKKATEVFSLRYTISLLNENNDPIGVFVE